MNELYSGEFPQPNEYYIGVVDPQLNPPPTGIASATDNFNAITFNPSPVNFAIQVVHEVGHNHGLQHVSCPAYVFPMGQSNEEFPSFPDGTIVSGGWGVLDGIYRDPADHYDYMGYCDPGWPSAHYWDTVLENLESQNTQP
jgi:hypothetical protein